jgi:GTP-binding protein EngB required for normal cell division
MQAGRHTSDGGQNRQFVPVKGETMGDLKDTSQVSSAVAGERLREYERLKLQLASLIQGALRLINERSDRDSHHICRDLLSKLAEDRFTLAVVGQFNRGKSSLMNAVVGLDRLPVGVVPVTSVITKVSYGNPERVLIEYPGSSLRSEIALEQLGEFVTEMGNPGNQKQIAAAEIQLPAEFLRRGLFFVDTPGVGSAIAANTATTERFLPEADAVIFVTSFDSPLGHEELQFLEKVRQHVRKVFFVVNKLDLVSPDQRDQVLTYMHTRLEQEIGLRETRLFAVSALGGLQAKLSGSAQGLAESGLTALEDSLVQFLTSERTGEFLLRICDRMLSLLGDLDAESIQGEQTGVLRDVVNRVSVLRGDLLGEAHSKGRLLAPSRPTMKSWPEAELMEAVRRPCQVCSKVADAMMKFMAKFQYQLVINEPMRSSLADRGGLCPLHTWQYAEIASPQGISRSYPAVLIAVSRRLNILAESDPLASLGARTRSLFAGPEKCRACEEQHTTEEKVITQIREELTGKEGQEPVQSPVLCLPHLSALLRRTPNSPMAHVLLEFEAAILERLAENMERYALKHDALRRGLQSEDERVAYHRGLSQLVGDKRLQAPWRVERLV